LWKGSEEDLTARRQEFEREFKTVEQTNQGEMVITQMSVEGATAVVRFVLNHGPADTNGNGAANKSAGAHRTLRLTRESQSWLITDYLTTEDDIARAVVVAGDEDQRRTLLEANVAYFSIELARALVSEGKGQFSHGSYQLAISVFELALKLMGRLNATVGPEGADAWLGIGDSEFFQSNYEAAKGDYEKGLEISRQAGYQRGVAFGLKDMGSLRQTHSDWDGALDLYGKSLEVAEAIGDKEAIARVLSNMGSMYGKKRDDAKALEFYQKSLILSEEIGRKDGIARTLVSIGDIHAWKQDYLEAKAFEERALKLFEEEGDREGIEITSERLATYWGFLGDHVKASEYWRRDLAIASQIGEKSEIAASLEGLGAERARLVRYREALRFYQQARDIRRKLGDAVGLADLDNYTGAVFRDEGNIAEALRYYHASLKGYTDANDKSGMIKALREIAFACEVEGDYDTADAYAQKSLKLSLDCNAPADEAIAYVLLGEIEEKKQAATVALEYGRKALSMFERSEDAEGISLALFVLGDVYCLLQHDYEKAAESYGRAVSIGRRSNALSSVWGALTGEGKAYRGLHQGDKARKSFLEAIATIEEMRKGTAGGPSQERYFFKDKIE
ncbi:MAG: tetratricopeptide repeat protein, partial [Blastocatellia bacterium]